MSWDPVWEDVFKANEWGKYPDESFIRFTARNFYKRERAKTKLLEVGCGPGANVWYMAREGFDVSGIDGSATAIAKAQGRLKGEGLAADMRVGDITCLPWGGGTFDGVGDNECLAHNSAAALDNILSEIKRVLKDGGLLYSRTFSDAVYKGKTFKEVAPLQYRDSSDGPFAGRGFFRLSDAASIRAHYGRFFHIVALDKIEYTLNNGAMTISEWVITCQK